MYAVIYNGFNTHNEVQGMFERYSQAQDFIFKQPYLLRKYFRIEPQYIEE